MEEKGTLVSVVIPVYNGEKFIKDAIRSVLSQTYRNIELIVVDDASTDSTYDRVKSIRDNRIRYIRNEKNRERAFSRNLGVQESKGRFVFFLDYDDMWEKDYVESVIENFTPETDIIFSIPRKFINEKGEIIRISKKNYPTDIGELIFRSMIGYPSCSAFKKSSFMGYLGKYIPREDWEIYLRSYINGLNIKILDNNKVMIREHSNRSSSNKIFMDSTIKLYIDYIGIVPKKYLPEISLHVGLTCLRFGNTFIGWKLVATSFLKKPSLFLDLRNVIYAIKWGIRLDRYFTKLSHDKNHLLSGFGKKR